MLFTRRPAAIDHDAYDPSPVRSPFIDIEKLPDGLDKLPNQLWPFCWFFLRQVKWPLGLFILIHMISSILISMLPYFAGQIVSVFEVHGIEQYQEHLTPVLISFFIWFVVIEFMAYHSARFVWADFSWSFRALIARQLQLYIRHHSISYFQNDFSGRLANKMNDVAENIRSMMRNVTTPMMFGVIQFLMALTLSIQVGGAFVVIFAVYITGYITILLYFVPRLMKHSMSVQDSKTVITGQLVDVMSNIHSVKVFARTHFEDQRTLGFVNDLGRKGRRMAFGFNKMYLCFDALVKPLWIAVVFFLVHGIHNETLTLSDAAIIIPLAISMNSILWWMTEVIIVTLESAGTVQDGINTLVKPFALRDKDNAAVMKAECGAITIQNVDFAYPSRPVFSDLNLVIPAGQKVGLVGPSGAGKSTLVQLLLRLHDVQQGSIMIDGQDVKDVTQDSLREHIAVIPQSSDLLHRSIRENIAYGRLDATEDDIIAAATKAHAHDFILSLSDHAGGTGYDAMVGERGVKLSGGQRQRIAIARAVLKNAPILLLDEATSALDSESERAIQQSLVDIMHGRTVIAIAHRLSTIARLDRLIVMDDGRIIEDGSHQELLSKNGLYARLWALQSGGFLGDH